MSFQTYPTKREEIYSEHLKEIANVKFTLREIDIIACTLHNRGAKKIGVLLDIAARTVSAHLYKIMHKLRSNSREHTIDLIEKSGKLLSLRLYYFNLLTEVAFIRMINTTQKLLNNTEINYQISLNSPDDSANILFLQITKYLSLANINIITDSSSAITGHTIDTTNFYLYIVDTAYNTDSFQKNSIVLLQNEYDSTCDSNKTVKYVDFTSKNNFYFSFIKLMEYLVDRVELQKIIHDFKTEYQALQDSWDGRKLQDDSHLDNISPVKQSSFLFLNIGLKASVIIGTILLIVIVWKEFVVEYSIPPTRSTAISAGSPETDPDIKLFLAIARNSDFSADNIRKEQMHKNYNIAKQMAKIVEYIDDTKIQSYLYSASISPEIVLDVAHNLHALSIYYMYNEHDGDKARKILLYTKNLLEHYISNHSNVEFNFDNLTKEEIHAELSIIKDLPEMYARVIYALGRTYIYQGNKQDATKYFEISQYISHQTGLFEEYLSIISGLEIIKKDTIDSDVKNGNHSEAHNKLHESIALYKKLKSNSVQYKLDYKPNAKVHNMIDPAKDLYNQVVLGEKIVKYYTTLITITDDQTKKSIYLQEILYQLCGTKGRPGILEQSKEISYRRAASMYNTVGNSILELYTSSTHIDSRQFQKAIVTKLGLANSDDSLDIAHQIFDLSISISRNTDFTKADAYDGMIRIYQAKIDTTPITIDQAKNLNAKILELQKKRDQINNSLKRTPN